MIHRRYHIRDGAKTAAGGTVRASIAWYKIDGIPVALEGDPVDCPACGTTGKIQCVMPRLPDDLNGKQIALSDDLCICQCSPAPRLIAEQTVKCQFILTADEEPTGAAQARQTTTAAHHFDERPRLVAPPIEGLPFYIETRDGRTFSGRAGAAGLLPRVATEGEEDYHLYWGDEALARMSGETAHG